MRQTVITISREHGSGGRLIGQKLALELGFLYYDRSIIEMAAEKSGLSPDFIAQSESRATNSFLFNLSASLNAAATGTSYQYDTPVTAKAYYAQASVIEDLAAKGNCIIVGRCADYILRGTPNLLRVFIRGEKEDRIRRMTEDYGEEADRIDKMDRGRSNYYRHFTNEEWGDMHGYDLIVNTSVTGIDGAVAVIKALVMNRKED